jgi:hypothetical protein
MQDVNEDAYMGKVILIHANCHNPVAKGDFAFAANIAKDLTLELQKKNANDIEVVLVSTLDGVPKFLSLYRSAVDGILSIEGIMVRVSSLEEFDAVENTVVAFIDANRCKTAPADLVKRVLAPDSRFLFIGNINQHAFADLFSQTLYRMQITRDQAGVYDGFHNEDMLIGSAGLSNDRLGLPTITKARDLPALESSEQATIPSASYGFMYLAAIDSSKDYRLIAQYIKLSNQRKYLLVGDFSTKKVDIQYAFDHDSTMNTAQAFPQIEYHQSLPSKVMRQAVATSSSQLVLSTGVTSTLEAMRDQKLTYYQDMSNNSEFVAAYLMAVKSLVSSDKDLFGALPQMIIELSNLLFASKPLNKQDMGRTRELLELSSVNSRLISANQTIIDQASGKIATKLLTFLSGSRKTQDQVQLATVCASLRKSGEAGSPVYDQALRRAATWGRLFELKVIIKSIAKTDVDKADLTYKRTALHWAVLSKKFDCARALVQAGVNLNPQDKEGQTPLHKAVQSADRVMIKMLIENGASIDIPDNNKISPPDCAPDSGTLSFVRDCHKEIHPSALSQVEQF